MNDGVEQQTQRIYQALLAWSFCPHHSHADRRRPFFGAFHALAVDDGSGRARFAFGLLAARDIERMVDAIESGVATLQY
jgi:hypothetical protein